MVATGDPMADELPQKKRALTAATRGLAGLISTLPADQLLARAAIERTRLLSDVEVDTEVGPTEKLSMRSAEYLQSVIAATPPSSTQKEFLSEEDWKMTWQFLENIFRLQDQVLVAESIILSSTTGYSGIDGGGLRILLSLLYAVRGKNYRVHIPAYFNDVLIPFSNLFEQALGVTSSTLISELISIPEKVHKREDQREAARKKIRSILIASGFWGPSPCNVDDPRVVMIGNKSSGASMFDQLIPVELQKWVSPASPAAISEFTLLPLELLDDLSWSPGEELSFLGSAEMPGWPTKTWPTRFRPFIKINDLYYCFDFVVVADYIFDVLRQLVWEYRPDLQDAWHEKQGKMTEDLACKYFRRLLPDADIYADIHYDGQLEGKRIVGECDAVIIYDDNLLIVEAKSARFGPQSPAHDFKGYLEKVRECAGNAVEQGDKFRALLKANKSLILYDSQSKRRRKKIATLRSTDFRRVTVVAVSLEPFTEFASRYEHLGDIGIESGMGDTWVISIDDLRLLADVFDNSLIFLHYLKQRAKGAHAKRIYVDDELDHLALYLSYNEYSRDPEGGYGDVEPDIIWNFGIRDMLDERLKPLDFGDVVDPIRQDMPARFQEVIDVLSASNRRGRAGVASLLLDAGGTWRQRFAEMIDGRLQRISETGAASDFSLWSHEGANVTAYCVVRGMEDDSDTHMLRYAKTLLTTQNETIWLLLKLTYSTIGVLENVAFRWIRQDDLSPSEQRTYTALGVKLRKNRVERELAQKLEMGLPRRERRIGRNALCPCGSGVKYKRCCGSR